MRLLLVALPLLIGVAAQAAETTASPGSSPDMARPTAGQSRFQRIGGFSKPMGVVYDAAGDRYFVANAAAGGLSAEGKGFISIVDADGRVKSLKWARRLNAPKGMRLREGRLYVADLNTIRILDGARGRVLGDMAIPDAYNLTDLSFDAQGNIWAVDSGRGYGEGAIYFIPAGGAPKLIARGTRFLNPLAIEFAGDELLIGPELGGNLLRVDLQGNVRSVQPYPMERLQGTVVRPGDSIGGLVLMSDGVVAASNRESGSVAMLDIAAKPPPSPLALVEDEVKAKGVDFKTAANDLVRKAFSDGRTISGGNSVPPARPESFAVRGLTAPGKFGVDFRRQRILIPEIGSDSVVLAQLPSPLPVVPRTGLLLHK